MLDKNTADARGIHSGSRRISTASIFRHAGAPTPKTSTPSDSSRSAPTAKKRWRLRQTARCSWAGSLARVCVPGRSSARWSLWLLWRTCSLCTASSWFKTRARVRRTPGRGFWGCWGISTLPLARRLCGRMLLLFDWCGGSEVEQQEVEDLCDSISPLD